MINKQLILLCLLSFYSSIVIGDQTYVYANIEANNLTISLNTSRKFINFGDIGIDSEKCSEGVSELCFKSESLLFVLPEKGKTITNKDWTSIRTFSSEYLFWGKILELNMVVITKSNGNVFTYWLSENSGVLIIKINLKDISSFFVLKGNCGYGAAASCKE